MAFCRICNKRREQKSTCSVRQQHVAHETHVEREERAMCSAPPTGENLNNSDYFLLNSCTHFLFYRIRKSFLWVGHACGDGMK